METSPLVPSQKSNLRSNDRCILNTNKFPRVFFFSTSKYCSSHYPILYPEPCYSQETEFTETKQGGLLLSLKINTTLYSFTNAIRHETETGVILLKRRKTTCCGR